MRCEPTLGHDPKVMTLRLELAALPLRFLSDGDLALQLRGASPLAHPYCCSYSNVVMRPVRPAAAAGAGVDGARRGGGGQGVGLNMSCLVCAPVQYRELLSTGLQKMPDSNRLYQVEQRLREELWDAQAAIAEVR